ncbi:hypothetical protein [Streptomyces sp. NPDC058653]|uniref:hypothetical protein n=1 Tax=Streptomyces sp. NPDC058653 TaxID=3346576 RepID=UPI00364E2284
MKPASVGRALRLGARTTVAMGMAVLGLGTAPAFAEEPTDQLWIAVPYEPTITVAPEGGVGQYRDLPVGLYHDNDTFTVGDGRLTVDVSGLAGVAEVAWPENCVPGGSTAVCSVPEVPTLTDDYEEQVRLKVRALPGTVSGAQGKITYEATAKGGPDGELVAPQNSFDTTVTVGSGPDLRVLRPDKLLGVRPGSSLTAPFSVTNNGNEAAQGFSVQMWGTYGLHFATKYPQCVYTSTGGEGEAAPMTTVTCAFDTVVAPGATVELPAPLRLDVAEHALYELLGYSVEPGAGAVDIQADDNYGDWPIEAVNTADFAVRGDTVRGRPGSTVTAELRFLNRGPAWVGHVGSGDPAAVVSFHVPKGTVTTAVPDLCEPRERDGAPLEERLGAPRYDCYLPLWVARDSKTVLPFQLEIDRVVPGATGKVVAHPGYGPSFPFDPKPRNNTAQVVVNP